MFVSALWLPTTTSTGLSQRSAQHVIANFCAVRNFNDINYNLCINTRAVARESLPSGCRRCCCPAGSRRGDIPTNQTHADSYLHRRLPLAAEQAAAGAPDSPGRPGPSPSRWRHPAPPPRDDRGFSLRSHAVAPPPWPSKQSPEAPGAPSFLEPRVLLSAILECHDLDALLLLLRNHEHILNVRHLDAALGRLGRLTSAAEGSHGGASRHQHRRDSGEAAAAAVARAAASRLLSSVLPGAAASLTPRDCASLLSALARLELPPPAAAAELLTGRLLAQLGRASVRDVAAALHAAAKLRLALPAEAVSQLLRRLDGELAAVGKPQDVSMVLWSLATLELCPPPLDWIRRLVAQMPGSRLLGFSPQALSNSGWALARLGCRPGSEWLGALVEAAGRVMESFSTPELVNLLWALAVMRHTPPQSWMARALGLLRDRSPGMNPQDVSSLCWSLAVLRVRPGLPGLQRLVVRALALRRQLSPQELVTTLWGLSRLGVQLPERVVALLLQGGLGATALYGQRPGGNAGDGGSGGGGRRNGAGAGRAVASAVAPPAVGPGDLAGAVLVLSYCRHVPPRRWLVRYCAAVARQLPTFGPRELSTLMYGIGRLGPMGLRLDPHWLDRLLSRVEKLAEPQPPSPPPSPPPRGLETSAQAATAAPSSAVTTPLHQQQQQHGERQQLCLDPSQLTVALWAVARLGHRPPGFWVASMARLVAMRSQEFAPREAAATIRALQELAAAAATASRRTRAVPTGAGGGAASAGLGASVTWDRSRSRGGRSNRRRGSSSGSSISDSSSTCCREAVAGLLAQLAGSLPERSLYGALRSASLLSRGGGGGGRMSYATVADQLLTDVYSVKSLGLLQGGGGGGDGGGQLEDADDEAAVQ